MESGSFCVTVIEGGKKSKHCTWYVEYEPGEPRVVEPPVVQPPGDAGPTGGGSQTGPGETTKVEVPLLPECNGRPLEDHGRCCGDPTLTITLTPEFGLTTYGPLAPLANGIYVDIYAYPESGSFLLPGRTVVPFVGSVAERTFSTPARGNQIWLWTAKPKAGWAGNHATVTISSTIYPGGGQCRPR